AFSVNPPGESMETPPTIFDLDSELGDMYYRAMNLAGKYAYAGRDYVIDKMLDILGASALDEVHNHHNFAWKERHFDEEYVVVRKGATPAFPGQRGFVGGSMADISVILVGVDSKKSREAFYSTIHGAGSIMSRTKSTGRMNWRTRKRRGGVNAEADMKHAVREYGVEIHSADRDVCPFVYRKLQEVLDAQEGTIKITHFLRPISVLMSSD